MWGINNGVNLNKIGYKKFFEAKISERGNNSSNFIFRKWSNLDWGINNGVNLNKIGYKKFFEAKISEG